MALATHHFLDRTFPKILAFFPPVSGFALTRLQTDLQKESISRIQQIYLRTLISQYCTISFLGSAFFSSVMFYSLKNHPIDSNPKLSILWVYTSLVGLSRINLKLFNDSVLFQLRAQPIYHDQRMSS